MAYIEMDFASGGGSKMNTCDLLASFSAGGSITFSENLDDYSFMFARVGTDTDMYGCTNFIPMSLVKSLNSIFISCVERESYNMRAKMSSVTSSSATISELTRTGWSTTTKMYLYGIK